MGRSRQGIDLVAGGRSKALVADRQAGMTHYIWRWRRTLLRETMRFSPTQLSGMPCVCLGEAGAAVPLVLWGTVM